MNTLSKVFVVVNLVFAVAFCFMTLTLYSKRVDWKEKYHTEERAHRQDLADKNRVIAGLEKEKIDLNHALEMKTRDHDELVQANKDLNQRLTDASDEKFEAMNEQGISPEMLKTMLEGMGRAMRTLAPRVRAGEFSSPEEVFMAFQQAMMSPSQ